MRSITSRLSLAAAAAVFAIGACAPALAQTEASMPAAAQATASQPLTKAQQRKLARAQRKAERKAAHAKNGAELKKLEDAGYKPAESDTNYPQNVQDAQKKANAAAGASQ
jgi:hypothetical protein